MDDARTPWLVVGLGNPIVSDDAVGWRVAHLVREALCDPAKNPPADTSVDVIEACVGGLSLAEALIDYDRAIVIDAIMTEGGVPGTVYHLQLDDLPGTLNTASAHDTNLATALRALRRLGAKVPADAAIEIVAVEAQDIWTFSEQCTPKVEQNIPIAAEKVLALLTRSGFDE